MWGGNFKQVANKLNLVHRHGFFGLDSLTQKFKQGAVAETVTLHLPATSVWRQDHMIAFCQ